jgi:hypothetical protein
MVTLQISSVHKLVQSKMVTLQIYQFDDSITDHRATSFYCTMYIDRIKV